MTTLCVNIINLSFIMYLTITIKNKKQIASCYYFPEEHIFVYCGKI